MGIAKRVEVGRSSKLSSTIPIPTSGRIAIPGREGQYFEARDLSTTPGGTVFGTTPGGSRIVYDRETLLAPRHSPMTKSPPKQMAKIPGVTVPIDYQIDNDVDNDDKVDDSDDSDEHNDGTTFKME